MSNSNNELGPFGRAFIGDFPTSGTLWLLVTFFLLSAVFSLGNVVPFLILLIISSSTIVYINYNFIEPHFNSKTSGNKSINSLYNNVNPLVQLSGTGRPKQTMSFQDSIRTCFKKWSSWHGRASRSEFNWFYLPITIFSEFAARIPAPSESNALLAFYFLLFSFLFLLSLVVFIPTIMVWIRRAHDIGFSGWYILLGLLIGLICYILSPFIYYIFIIPFTLVFILTPSQKITNKFGPVPTNNFDKDKISPSLNEVWDLSGSNIFGIFQKDTMAQDTGFANFIFSRQGPVLGIWGFESKTETWVKVLTAFIGIFLLFELSSILSYKIIIIFDIYQIDLFLQLSSVFIYLLAVLLILLILNIEGKFDYFRDLIKLPTRQRPLIIILLCGGILILDFILSGFFAILISSGLDDYFIDSSSDSNIIILLLYFISLVIAAPLIEELFFRGYLLDKIRTQHSDIFAIMITGLFFGLIHWTPYWDFWDFSPILFTGIGGVLYAWLRIKTGSIWPSIICHSIWNLFAGIIFML